MSVSSLPPDLSSFVLFSYTAAPRDLDSFPTRRSSDLRLLPAGARGAAVPRGPAAGGQPDRRPVLAGGRRPESARSEEHTSELQSRQYLVCRLLLEKKNEDVDALQHQLVCW